MRPPLHPNLLGNPDFATGATNWVLGPGWSVSNGGRPYGGNGNIGIFTPVGQGSLFNQTRIVCFPGGAVRANCWAVGEPGAGGQAALRINWVDVNGQRIGNPINSSFVPNNYVWTPLSLVAIAPPNVSFALIDFTVYGDNNPFGRWACTYFFGTYLPGAISQEPVTYKQPLSYYMNLFTSQYKLSPKLNQWQAALMQPIDDLTNCLTTMNLSYDIDNAFGVQLDVLGEIIGVSRTVPFQPSGGVSPVLDDETYRTLLYATQAMDLWDGKTASLYPIWQFIFPGVSLVINDFQNMTAGVVVSGPLSSIEQDLITHGMIVPRPETVQYNATPTTGALFGFDLNNSSVAGFDTGHFA